MPISRAKSKFDVSFRECTLWNSALRLRFAFLALGPMRSERCCGQLQVIKQTKNWRLPRFCIGHFQTQKSSTDVEFWSKTCFYDFCGPRISTFFRFLCSSFLFPPKNNGFSTKKQSSQPTQPTPSSNEVQKSSVKKNQFTPQPTKRSTPYQPTFHTIWSSSTMISIPNGVFVPLFPGEALQQAQRALLKAYEAPIPFALPNWCIASWSVRNF